MASNKLKRPPSKKSGKKNPYISEEEAIGLLSVIADPAKLRIARLLSDAKEMRSGDIADQFEISRTTISHHLSTMKIKGFVSARKVGKEVYYSLNKEHMVALLKGILCFIEK